MKSLFLIFFCQFLLGQIVQDFSPMSIISQKEFQRKTIVLPNVDVQNLLEQDERMSHLKKMRFGYEHVLDQNFIENANNFKKFNE